MTAITPNEASSALLALGQATVGSVTNNVSTESPFTARLQLLHGLSKVRVDWDKERGPKPDEGNFWMGPPGDVFLGKRFTCVPLAWRDHALCTKGDTVLLESYQAPPLGQMPKSSDESVFLEIKTAAAQKNKQAKDVQNRCGKDVLLWVPRQAPADPRWPGMNQASNGKFAIYFLAGTAVPEADNFKAFFYKKTSVRAKEVNGKSFMWYVPEVDLEDQGVMQPEQVPDLLQVKEELLKFANPIAKGENMPKAATPTEDGRPR